MKRFLPLALAVILIAPQASAAPKPITPTLGSIFSAPVGSEGVVLSGQNTVLFQNINQLTADIQITALDVARNQIWQRVIDSQVDEIAMAATVDPAGTIWLAGAVAPPKVIETATSVTGIDNPDNVVVENVNDLRPDMTNLAVWKVSPSGELLATFQSAFNSVPTVTGIAANNLGVSIIGTTDSKPFLSTLSPAGVFGKILTIGSANTELNAVARSSDGSTSIFGSSSETLAGKKVAGKRDGILIKVSKAGVITALVRSSAIKALRSWVSGDSSHLTSGPVIVSAVTETAITKFSPTFTPTWSYRVPSSGPSLSLTANGNSYLAVSTSGAIAGISQWKPAKPSLLVLTFDSKGVVKAVTALPGLVKPLALQYSAALGVQGLASAEDGTVSIFTLVSR
ncbi:MAG: hypothetical protein ACKOXI_04885 [Candidatus Planktophila sp.]